VLLFFSVTNETWAFGHYPTLILTIFEATDVNRFLHAYAGKKFLNFCAGDFPGPKTAKNMAL